jgi:mRNA interferase MazF
MVRKWGIYILNLDPTVGSEQKGIRPALVISNDSINKHLSVFTVLPFSSIKLGKMIYPSEVELPISVTGLNKNSVVMLQQIRTISIDRIIDAQKIGEITDLDYRNRINQALIEYFEL